MKRKIIFSILIVLLTATLGGCNTDKYSPVEDAKSLANIVYTASVNNQGTSINEVIRKNKLSNNFYYREFRIYESFGFNITLDFTMEPYFNNYVIGEEIFVVIALLEFTPSTFEEFTWLQKMIILSYKDEIVGFMSPYSGKLMSQNGYDFNNPQVHHSKDYQTYYIFSSHIFLTENEIVSYYEKDDTIYHFDYIEYINGSTECFATIRHSNSERTIHDVNILEDSYCELNSNVVIDLINLTIIETVYIEAVITGFEDFKKLIVESVSHPSLKTVYCRFAALSVDGLLIDFTELEVGDNIIISYYNRYHNYLPVDITVDNVIVK